MLLLQGVFDHGSCTELPGFAPETKLFKPFLAEGLRDKVESVINAATEDRKRIPAPAPEERVAPGPVTISDDELDRALSEALRELKAESPAQEVEESGFGDMGLSLDALEVEPEVIDDNQLDEGVGREESAELIEKATVVRVKTTTDEDELMEATAVTEDIESIGKGTMGDREFMDEMIDGLVDRVMERFSIELKASLKRSLNEKMRQMARRAVQELLPKLSERLIAEMFKSESEKQQ
jgi:hypothetical protein